MASGNLQPGVVVAEKYVIDRVVGEGGMGTVYATTHRVTGKRLALKCLLPSYVLQPHAVERFLREARTAGRIHHRHVIDVFDVGRDGDVLYMVMPLLDGRSFSQMLFEATLTVSEALRILARAMEGVAAAHDQGVTHRDLKPGNLFVCEGVSGRLDDPRVLDFGISKLQGDAELSLTTSGTSLGTPYYMAIEQLTGQRDVDHRVDVHAMGVILYETLSGRLPHRAENVAALALHIMHREPEPLHLLRADLPEPLCAVVMQAMARDRDARFPTMRGLIEAIRPYVPHELATSAATTIEPRIGCSPRAQAAPDPVDACAPTDPISAETVNPSISSVARVGPAARTSARIGWIALTILGAASLLAIFQDSFGAEAPDTRAQPASIEPPTGDSAREGAQAPPAPPMQEREGGSSPTDESTQAAPAAEATSPTAPPPHGAPNRPRRRRETAEGSRRFVVAPPAGRAPQDASTPPAAPTPRSPEHTPSVPRAGELHEQDL